MTERTAVEDPGEPPTTARWLAWATAVLLIIGIVSAGVMHVVDGDPGDGLVTAAGQTEGTVDLASTTTTFPPTPPPTERQPTASSTTVPKAAAAVLKALGTTAPPTTRPTTTTSTTAAPVTTTTTTPSTTTSTTVRPGAGLIIANRSGREFDITVNARTFRLVDGGVVTVQLDLPGAIRGEAVGEPACTVGATGDLFQSGRSYRVDIVAGDGSCPRLTVTP